MNRTQVFIWEGEYSLGTTNRPLTLDGQPVKFNYRGEAVVEGDKLVIPFSDYDIREYQIQPATPASLAYTLGYEHARYQQRRRQPSPASAKFAEVATEHQSQLYGGWQDAWEQRQKYGRPLF